MDRPAPIITLSDPSTIAGHATAIASVAASVFGYLPPVLTGIATFLAILWYSVVLWENKTVQSLRHRLFEQKPQENPADQQHDADVHNAGH